MEKASGLDSMSMATKSRRDSLSGVDLTARTSTSSLSQPSMRTVPFTLLSSKEPSGDSGKVLLNSWDTAKQSGARNARHRERARPERRNMERSINVLLQGETEFTSPGTKENPSWGSPA